MLVVMGTFPDRETALRIARCLVEEGLVACVNLFPGVESIYRWEGVVESSSEVGFWMKTQASSYPLLETRFRALHPYEVPALVALPISDGLAPFLDWIRAQTGLRESR